MRSKIISLPRSIVKNIIGTVVIRGVEFQIAHISLELFYKNMSAFREFGEILGEDVVSAFMQYGGKYLREHKTSLALVDHTSGEILAIVAGRFEPRLRAKGFKTFMPCFLAAKKTHVQSGLGRALFIIQAKIAAMSKPERYIAIPLIGAEHFIAKLLSKLDPSHTSDNNHHGFPSLGARQIADFGEINRNIDAVLLEYSIGVVLDSAFDPEDPFYGSE